MPRKTALRLRPLRADSPVEESSKSALALPWRGLLLGVTVTIEFGMMGKGEANPGMPVRLSLKRRRTLPRSGFERIWLLNGHEILCRFEGPGFQPGGRSDRSNAALTAEGRFPR